jgi:hypothetical protein
MMAVQAPGNWGIRDSEGFFKRHFYRALLQRMFLDFGFVGPPRGGAGVGEGRVSPAGHSSGGTPIVIGSLRKACYVDFVSYVRGALGKLMGSEPAKASCSEPEANGEAKPSGSESVPKVAASPNDEATSDGDEEQEPPNIFAQKMGSLTDEEILRYEREYSSGKKALSVIWSLMAFSAGVIEAAIVVDRWLWLREQEDLVGESWVEAVFEYGVSPRNLVVVGVKK